MLLVNSIITEKNRKRTSKNRLNTRKIEDKIEDLKQNTLIEYYLNGGH